MLVRAAKVLGESPLKLIERPASEVNALLGLVEMARLERIRSAAEYAKTNDGKISQEAFLAKLAMEDF